MTIPTAKRRGLETGRVLIVLVGAFGGLAPILLRLATDLQNRRIVPSDIDTSLCLGMLLYAALGGTVAAIWNERNLKKTLYIGLGFPSLFTVLTGTATTPAKHGSIMNLSQTVLADDKPVAGRFLTFRLQPPVDVGELSAVFRASGGRESSIPIRLGSQIPVPGTARTVYVSGASAESDPISLPSNPGWWEITLTSDKNTWYGFQYAIGIHSKPLKLGAVLQPSSQEQRQEQQQEQRHSSPATLTSAIAIFDTTGHEKKAATRVQFKILDSGGATIAEGASQGVALKVKTTSAPIPLRITNDAEIASLISAGSASVAIFTDHTDDWSFRYHLVLQFSGATVTCSFPESNFNKTIRSARYPLKSSCQGIGTEAQQTRQ